MAEDEKIEIVSVQSDISENNSEQHQAKKEKRRRRKKQREESTLPPWYKKGLWRISFVSVGIIAILILIMSAKIAYNTKKEDNIESVYNAIYNNSFNAAEAKTHVSNRLAIAIGDIREMANLEVLRASDIEYVVTNSDDNPDNIISWLEVPGTGVFTVDLSCGEYIVDSQSQYVFIRVPQPILSNFKVDNENVKQLLWKDDIFDGSVKVGEDEMRNQINEGAMRLKEYFLSNRIMHDNVLNSAKNMIKSLVKQFNPNLPNLTVEVEFIEEL